MAIVQTVGQAQFQDAFKGESYSYEAVNALYEYYDELSDSLDEPFELDVVAIRGDWYEYDNFKEVQEQYGDNAATIEHFQDYTGVIELDNGHVLVQAF